jgi:hypothetical protein
VICVVCGRRTSLRYFWFLLLAPVVGCSSPARPFEGNEAVENFKAQAAKVEHAMINADHQQMADLTHPILINHFGGREGYIRELEQAAADLRRQGLKFHAFSFGGISQVFESAGELYAIYPYTLDLTGPNGEPASKPSYLVCTSSDSGATWKFLDGAGVGSDRRKLTRLLPGFPAELALPDPQPLVVYR